MSAKSQASVRRSSRHMTIKQSFKEDIDFDLEEMLAEHERDGIEFRAKRDAKRFKSEEREVWKDPGYSIPLDSLPALCVERIYAFIDNPQDLYNLCFLNKFLMSLVTPEVVIRSAVFNNLRKRDTRHRKTISNIMGYLSNRSIHIPSSHRMLRLLIAKQCERGDMCWGKNLSTGKPMNLDAVSSWRPFGLAICDKCIKFGTTNIPYSHFSRFQQGVAFYQWNKLMDPQMDLVTGEFNGSLVKVIQLQQIESSFESIAERKEALDSIVARAHVNEGKYCPLQYEEKAAVYVQIFESAEKEADELVSAEQKKEHELYTERREERLAKRLLRVRSIYDQLDELLADCPLKDLALDCTWREDDTDCLKFSCTLVEQAMRQIIGAPSSSSDRMIKDAATRIKEAFTILVDKKFFTYSFLSDSSNRYKKGMYEYCTTEMTPLKIMSASYADTTFLRLVEQNQPTKALVRVFNMIRSALPRCFALAVVRTNSSADEDLNMIDNYRKLAEAVWKRKATTFHQGISLPIIKENFNACLEEFKTMKKNADEYLVSEESRAFFRRDPPVGHQVGTFTRQMALEQVFSPGTTESYFPTLTHRVSPYAALKNRNFSALRSIHEAYFRRPAQYGL